MAFNFIHGRLTTVQYGGSYFAALNVDFNGGLSDLTDITYTQTGGATWRIMLPGYSLVDGSTKFVYDTLNQPVLAPQNMTPGQLMTMIFSPDGTKLYTLTAYAETLSIPGGPGVKGPVICTAGWKSSGTVLYPAA